ncbi:putative membrane protein [Roseovarius sp. MBR-51]|jgi:uncharacterized membrane protein
MNHDVVLLIGGLAVATFAIRSLGLVTGNFFQASRFAWVLQDLPGILIVALVSSSLANMSLAGWLAAAAALGVAILSNHVILTMMGGVATFALLQTVL